MAKSRRITYVFGADISELERGWKRIDYQLKSLSRNVRNYGMAMSKAFTVPLAAIGGVATKAALDTDKAVRTIARGTGAQGEALRELEREWRKLAVSVTQSFEDSARVLADYNTRLGLTGKALRDVSKQALDASRMMGEDVNSVVTESAKAMQSWGVEAENMSEFLDKIFKASQTTGVGMSSLSSQLYRYGASLKAMGFDLDSSIALLAQFEREGVNVERIMSAMTMGLNRMARSGVADVNQAFIQLIREIQNAKTNTEAANIAVKVFGRSGAEMAVAIREGRFSVENLINSLREADGVIQQTTKSTDTFAEAWSRTKNSLMLALEPIGREILNIAERTIPRLQQATERLATSIANMSDSSIKKIVEFAGVLAVGGPLLIAISATINAVRNLASVVLASFVLPGSPWVLAAASVGALVYALKDFDKIQKQITGRTPAEVLDRSKYMQRAGEIFAERHGKYPITVEEYKELDRIIDELIAKERKVEVEVTPKITAPKGTPTIPAPQIGAPIDLSKLLDTESKKRADEAAKAERERIRQIGITTAAEIERIEKVKQMQLEAQEAAAEGVRRFWRDVNWEYNQGLIDAQSYFDMLSGELERVTQGSEEWKRTFQEIQRVALDIVNTNIDALTEQLRAGKITTEEFNEAVARLKAQFQDLPLAVNQLDSVLKTTAETSKTAIDLVRDLGMTFQSAFEDAIIEGENLRSVLAGLLEDLARIILRMYVIKPLVNSLMGFMGSAFGLPAFKMHSGGVVGLAGTPMTVPAGMFIGAPRLHNGLAPDEFPAILQKGETVLPRGADTPSSTSVKIVNVLDPSIVGNYLGTAEGERVIVNIMQRNIRRLT
jgi:TP901 family phage tail tape measure protein